MANEKIAKKLNELPKTPGVYFHKNSKGQIIYVGKAAVLRNRVRQYFQKSRVRDTKTDLLVKEVADIDWVEVDTELDALFLEAELIKRYQPKYNVDLRDDKSSVYVRIDSKSDHPTVSYTRRPLDDGAQYFGPFNSKASIQTAMKLLRKIFPFDYKVSSVKNRVSLDYHLGLSPGLEEQKTTLSQYRKNLGFLKRYLKGQRIDLINDLEKQMKQEAEKQNFESATILRNQLLALKNLRKQVVFASEEFMDITKDQALSGLADLLNLPNIPKRIEGFDISHQSGSNNVASMVVFNNGLPNKTEYRKFKMHLKGNDDFAHMREVMSRRFSKSKLTSWPKPDLILIDGGKGQLQASREVLESLNINIPAIGLAKRLETIIVKRDDAFEEILLPKSSATLKLLQRVRDESHRFAVSYHSSLKRQAQTKNLLEEIPGIGPATRKKLLRFFGSVKQIQLAELPEIEKIVGKSKAEIVYKFLLKAKD